MRNENFYGRGLSMETLKKSDRGGAWAGEGREMMQRTFEFGPEFICLTPACKRLRVSKKTLKGWLDRGCPSLYDQNRNRLKISLAEIKDWLATQPYLAPYLEKIWW